MRPHFGQWGPLGAVGTLSMRGGKGTANSLPKGWVIRSIKPRARGQRGRLVLAVDYQAATATGWIALPSSGLASTRKLGQEIS